MGFDKNTNQITFNLIQCLFMKKKNKKPITNQPVMFLIEASCIMSVVHWGIFSTLEDAIKYTGDVMSTPGGVQYTGRIKVLPNILIVQ